ncbi:hypothetical protein [Herminiimonas sp. CN]|uniref:hypothetical protein n=1 Tax=Herminiimonas sp. CN TaxID=1349818 RepID=UPI000473C469|nr:hypothetical protein [Herminiimonas sp. CN]
MAGSMSRADLAADLAASLHDAAESFVDAGDMARLLDVAALDFSRHRPRTLLGTLTAEVGRMDYPAPANLYLFKSSLWGIAPVARAKPWERQWPGPMPDVHVADGVSGRELHLTPAPTQLQLMTLGSEFRYYYFGQQVIGDTTAETTLPAGDRFLLLLRAQAEAMREMSMRNIKKPVQMRDGLHSAPRNMTPAALHVEMMREWESKVARLGV